MIKKALAIAVALLASALSLASGAPDAERSIAFKVRVCEGEEFVRLMGAEADARWSDCETPIAGTPIMLVAGDETTALIETDDAGVARVGPVSVASDVEEIRLLIGCTKHVCMTLRLDPVSVADGENPFLYHTLTHERMKEQMENEKESAD